MHFSYGDEGEAISNIQNLFISNDAQFTGFVYKLKGI